MFLFWNSVSDKRKFSSVAFVNSRGLGCCLSSFFVCGVSFYQGEVGGGVLFHLNMELLKKNNPNSSGVMEYGGSWQRQWVEIKNVFELLVFHSPDAQQNGSKSFPLTLFRTFINYAAEWDSVWGICLCVLMDWSERPILQKERILCCWFKGPNAPLLKGC